MLRGVRKKEKCVDIPKICYRGCRKTTDRLREVERDLCREMPAWDVTACRELLLVRTV